jgi:hypothetical protein
MANMNESIEQFTASLQELTQTYCHGPKAETVPVQVSVEDLRVSAEVQAFVDATRAYSERTRNVSVGTY